MSKFLIPVSVLLFLATPALARQDAGPGSASATPNRTVVKPQDIEGEAAKARGEAEKLYKRIDQGARQAVRSMCVECLGARYNQPGPKTPYTLSDELSAMKGEPQFEQEP